MKKSRRSFMKKFLAGAAVASAPFSILKAEKEEYIELKAQKYGPNDKIRLACIGMGIQGYSCCRAALKNPGVELVAVCDLYNGRLESSIENFGDHLFVTRNYKEILERRDIDAVIVATSDHWHDHISIEAMNKGKHVYCEKPMVHKIEEGRAMIDAQNKTGKVLQVGSQRVSSILWKKAAELYSEGVIGDLILVEAVNDRASAKGAWQYSIPTDASEKTVDWNAFLGDAPKRDYDPVRFFRWRNYQDYGTGVAGDLFVHLFSGLHVVTGSNGPNRIFSTGGLRFWKDGRDVPDVIMGLCDYPEAATHPAFNLQLRVNFVDGGGGGSLMRLVGTEGTMDIGWRNITIKGQKISKVPGYGGWDSYHTFSKKQQAAYKEWYEATYPKPKPEMLAPTQHEYRMPEGYSDHVDHFASFFNGIRNGADIVEDASFGLRAAAPSLASNLSYFQKKVINWDPDAMKLV
jgi:predicted dehydrogenase